VGLVCKNWQQLSRDDFLWKKFCYERRIVQKKPDHSWYIHVVNLRLLFEMGKAINRCRGSLWSVCDHDEVNKMPFVPFATTRAITIYKNYNVSIDSSKGKSLVEVQNKKNNQNLNFEMQRRVVASDVCGSILALITHNLFDSYYTVRTDFFNIVLIDLKSLKMKTMEFFSCTTGAQVQPNGERKWAKTSIINCYGSLEPGETAYFDPLRVAIKWNNYHLDCAVQGKKLSYCVSYDFSSNRSYDIYKNYYISEGFCTDLQGEKDKWIAALKLEIKTLKETKRDLLNRRLQNDQKKDEKPRNIVSYLGSFF
jgi:hypothetical protein